MLIKRRFIRLLLIATVLSLVIVLFVTLQYQTQKKQRFIPSYSKSFVNRNASVRSLQESNLNTTPLITYGSSKKNINITTNAPPTKPAKDGLHAGSGVTGAVTSKVRILCWVMTNPDNHKSKAIHVLKTWGRRCDKLLFVTEGHTSDLPNAVKVKIQHGREHLTAKTMNAFDHIYEHHLDEADWFMKADDDTYVIVDNLRYFLSSEDPNDAVYFGHHFHVHVKQGYFSGGAGYVLSREALVRFGVRKSSQCIDDGGAEDVAIGKCMEVLGVRAGDSRDSMNRSRFHCFDPETHLEGRYPDWYLQYDKYGAKSGQDSMSDYPISFHYVGVRHMYHLEYYFYHARAYGFDVPPNVNRPHNIASNMPSTSTVKAIVPVRGTNRQ